MSENPFIKGPQRLGEVLISKGMISHEKLELALAEQKYTKELLGITLVSQGSLAHKELAIILAEALKIPYIDLDINLARIDPAAVSKVPEEIAKRFKVMPYKFDEDTLTVAMENPNDVASIDVLKRITGTDIDIVVADLESILKAIGLHYELESSLENEIDKNSNAALGGGIPEGEVTPPIIRLVELFFIKAVSERATDIHMTPHANFTRVSFRIDGIIGTSVIIPRELHPALVTRIKVISGLNISEQRLPQDGATEFEFAKRQLDVRVSTSPCEHGENVVMRVLDKSNILMGMKHLGLDKKTADIVRNLAAKPDGIILSAGPTGAGKTTTLYSMLKEINPLEKNILTVEDPIEYRLPLIKQTQVNEVAGLTFSRAIKHFLRQDPDVILVGEIRDLSAAQSAFQAALTGHLVLSTIHTTDASSSISRFFDLGVEPYLIPTCLRAIIAQRLVRTNCEDCKEPYTLGDEEAGKFGAKYAGKVLYRGKGCANCYHTGFRGRVGIFEVLEITPKISSMISDKAPAYMITREAKKGGMRTLKEDGFSKALAGLTTFEEVVRVTG